MESLNRLRAFLDEYFPEFPMVFKHLLGKAAWWVLRQFPLPQDILALSPEKLAEYFKAANNRRVGIKRARALQEQLETQLA